MGAHDVGSATLPVRGSAQLLADPVFGPFFGAQLVSTAGIWIYNIVAAILAFELSGSALVVGLVSVAQFGPQLVLAPLAGALADRGDRRLLLIAGKLLVALASGGLALWIALVGVDGLPGTWPVLAASFGVGLGFVLVGPSQNALLPALVRPGELAPAIALNSVPPTLARAGGPALGALVAATAGPATAFAITSITNLAFVVVMSLLDVRARADNGGGVDRRVRVGVRHVRSDAGILPLLVGVAAVGVGADPAITLTPSLSVEFGAGSALVGLFASAFGIGAGAAFFVLTALRRRVGLVRLGVGGLFVLAIGLVAVGLSPTATLAAVSFAVAGSGMTAALTALTTQLQERLPDDVRGRVMALWAVAFLGSRPLAAAVNGAVADATAPVVALLLVAALVAAAAWYCRPRTGDRPPPDRPPAP